MTQLVGPTDTKNKHRREDENIKLQTTGGKYVRKVWVDHGHSGVISRIRRSTAHLSTGVCVCVCVCVKRENVNRALLYALWDATKNDFAAIASHRRDRIDEMRRPLKGRGNNKNKISKLVPCDASLLKEGASKPSSPPVAWPSLLTPRFCVCQTWSSKSLSYFSPCTCLLIEWEYSTVQCSTV